MSLSPLSLSLCFSSLSLSLSLIPVLSPLTPPSLSFCLSPYFSSPSVSFSLLSFSLSCLLPLSLFLSLPSLSLFSSLSPPFLPGLNVTFDPRTMTLRWPCQENTTNETCFLKLFPLAHLQSRGGECSCTFMQESLHRGLTLEVQATVNQRPVQEKLLYTNPGMPGSGAVNFSCLIYRITFMNCTWVPGPAAPADVIYHLYSWDDDEVECPQYLLDLRGTRVGCHFDQLGEPNRWDNYFFFINGTSQESLIPFVDFVPFVAVQNEKYNAPANVTVHNRGPETVIAWDNPHRRFDLAPATFCYELDLQRKVMTPNPGTFIPPTCPFGVHSRNGPGHLASLPYVPSVTKALCPQLGDLTAKVAWVATHR
uniref:Granulocyte-macrophage colony-stimulating factor receptor subunit alpha n=1 Tax=Castor canadensis TaxID=51338 RepID=A0A8C0WBS9_CASCN